MNLCDIILVSAYTYRNGGIIMPATITHAYFAKDVYEILPSNIKDKLNVKRVKMFGQSTDPLMFYNLFSVLPGKKIRKLDHYFHTHKTQEFFINLINYIKENNLSDDEDVSSFLVGFICHYMLDSTVHPYVIYKTGQFDEDKPSTYKYNNIHGFMEAFIDNDMVRRRNKTNPYTFPLEKFCFSLEKFSTKLNKVIDYAFKKTYKQENISKIYYKSLKQMKWALVLFRKDRYGIKKNVYKFIDTFTTKKTYRFEAVSYHYPLEDKHNFLNSNHKEWRNPAVYDMTSTESFIDLYLKALKQAKVLVCGSFDYINGKDIDLKSLFTNKSYVTGLDCDEKKELKYFEF